MKVKQTIISIVTVAMLYSCGGNSGSNQAETTSKNTAVNNTQHKTEAVDRKKPESKLKKILDTIKHENIHIIKYKGTLGKSNITLQLPGEYGSDDLYLYMYDNLNNPLLLEADPKANYIRLNELFPKKKDNKQYYKKGGTLTFKNNKKYDFELRGQYTNPKGTKTYPVSLQATEIITKNTKGSFEELQKYSTPKHYFTVESSWKTQGREDKFKSVDKINVYYKKTNKKLQSLDVPFKDNLPISNVEPTNTKPNGIQIGCTPLGINDAGLTDYIAFLWKNGKYKKDSTVCGKDGYDVYSVYSRYDKNGDIVNESYHMYRGSFCEKIYVTSKLPYKKEITTSSVKYGYENEKFFDTYIEITSKFPESGEPTYESFVRKDKKTDELLYYSVKTNYPKEDYKLSTDGKTLLKCEILPQPFDLNGQEDLRKVEKIDKHAFLQKYDDGEILNEAYLPHSIILNPNFKEVPKELEMYDILKERTKLAPTCLDNK